MDGTYQRGYLGSPLIEINGSNAGVIITAGGSTLNGLNINSTSGYGLTLSALGGNIIKSNVLSGIMLSSAGNKIEGNVISNLNGDGISIIEGGINNEIGVLEPNNISNNSGHKRFNK